MYDEEVWHISRNLGMASFIREELLLGHVFVERETHAHRLRRSRGLVQKRRIRHGHTYTLMNTVDHLDLRNYR